MQAFILAWTAWEAYNYRFAVAAIQMQGLTQKDAKEVLANSYSFQIKNMNRIRNRLLLDKPTTTEGVMDVWQQLESDRGSRTFRERRHGLVHGSASADPRILRRGTDVIIRALEPTELLESIRVRVRFGDAANTFEVVGKVLVPTRRKAGSKAGTGNQSEIVQWLR